MYSPTRTMPTPRAQTCDGPSTRARRIRSVSGAALISSIAAPSELMAFSCRFDLTFAGRDEQFIVIGHVDANEIGDHQHAEKCRQAPSSVFEQSPHYRLASVTALRAEAF